MLAKLLGPDLFAVNSLSSQLLMVLAFLDLGAMISLRRSLPRTAGDELARLQLLCVTRKVSLLSYFAGTLIMLFAGIWGHISGHGQWSLAFLAAGTILPIQGTVTFRSAIYTADNKQVRATSLLLLAAMVNVTVTLACFDILHEGVIVLGPAAGFGVALLADSFTRGATKLPFSLVTSSNFRWLSRYEYRTMFLLCCSQWTAVALVNLESYFSFVSMSAHDVGCLGLIMNILVVVSIFPISLSNQMSPAINHANRKQNNHVIIKMLKASRRLLLVLMLAVILYGTLAFQFLIEWKLPLYVSVIPTLWIMSISTYLYTVTFYASSYAMSKDKQNEILSIQIFALLIQVAMVIVLVLLDRLTLSLLAWTALAKFVTYHVLQSRALKRISNGQLGQPVSDIVTTLVFALPLVAAAYFATNKNVPALVLVCSGVGAVFIVIGKSSLVLWKEALTTLRLNLQDL